MLIDLQKNFAIEECCKCGCLFAITDDMKKNLKTTKDIFYCPNGHSQIFTKSLKEEYEEKLLMKQNIVDKLVTENFQLSKENNNLKRKKKKK